MADKEWWETCGLDEWDRCLATMKVCQEYPLNMYEGWHIERWLGLLNRARAQEARIKELEEPLEYDERAELLERKQAQLKAACALNGEYETRIRELEDLLLDIGEG